MKNNATSDAKWNQKSIYLTEIKESDFELPIYAKENSARNKTILYKSSNL